MISRSTIAEISSALSQNRDVALVAPPGSGKTTIVPPALIDEPWLKGKKIVMLEPRRLAARSCAAYIARSLGEDVGGTVGYQVRLDRRVSAKTRLEIVTEGLLAQRILSDPELSDVGLVVFDEIHERSLQCDLSFALALEVRRALRPDLRLLAMSATMDSDEIMRALGDGAEKPPALVTAEGRSFPVETIYLGGISMPAAVSVALKESDGDILCFLPGEGEIRRCEEALGDIGGVEVLPLYGALPKEEQDRVFRRESARRVILSTSIAETSVTIEGISCVIDSGLMRVPRFSPGTGMTGLVTLPLSLDRAEQRRGRAGRLRPGTCYRLWTRESESSRPKKALPEIMDADLCRVVLASAAWGALRRTDLPWITPPPAGAWEQASGLLALFGAIGERGEITQKGRDMAAMPVHPRLANMLMGCGDMGGDEPGDAAVFAAIIEEGFRGRETDISVILDEVRASPNRPDSRRILALARRFARMAPHSKRRVETPLALAYPERIGKNRGNGSFTMVCGRGAFLDYGEALAKERYLVCCELDDRKGDARIFLACPVGEGEIEALFGDKIESETICEWDRVGECAKCVVRRKLGAMAISEKPAAKTPELESKIAEAMVEGVRAKGVWNMPCWSKESMQLVARVNFLHRAAAGGADDWPEISEKTLLPALGAFVSGMSKWRDLEKLDISSVIRTILLEKGIDLRRLDALAPSKMEVPSGSRVSIDYSGDEPMASVKLQECFGLMETPKVAGGKVPVVMSLLSPAQRPIQVTKDLAGFWRGAYQLVRKDMRGRYPKHYWPEDPLTATPRRRTLARPLK